MERTAYTHTAAEQAVMSSGGVQEATIVVQDGYWPDRVLVRRDRPVKLTFRREEANPCSEVVVFEAFGKSAKLPRGERVTVELVAREPGEYPFTCEMGMYRGTLVVE